MKALSTLIVSAGICMLASCGSGTGSQDSTDSAKAINDSTISAMKDSSSSMAKTDSSAGNTAGNYSTTPLEKADGRFVVEAADGGMTEIAASQLAQNNATDQRIKDFANMMVTDHTKAGDELKKLAAAKGLTLPDKLGDKPQQKIDNLGKKTGKQFDKMYVNMMLNDHKRVVDLFQKEANDSKDADLKTWVTSTLPTLQMHLDSIKAISGKQ